MDKTAFALSPSFQFGFKIEIVPWSTHRSPWGSGLEIALRLFPKTHWNVTGVPVWTVPGEDDDGEPEANEEIAANQYRTVLSFVKTPWSGHVSCSISFMLLSYWKCAVTGFVSWFDNHVSDHVILLRFVLVLTPFFGNRRFYNRVYSRWYCTVLHLKKIIVSRLSLIDTLLVLY